MNLEKSQKRITKKAKKGFQGYPLITIQYHCAAGQPPTAVTVGFKLDEAAEIQTQSFSTAADIRLDVGVQTTILKMIERTEAKSVTLEDLVTPLPPK